MGDLISREAVINRFKQLKGPDTLANMFVSDVIKVVAKIPVAYDVDKVVEQMESKEMDDSDMVYLSEVIAIVRGGGDRRKGNENVFTM